MTSTQKQTRLAAITGRRIRFGLAVCDTDPQALEAGSKAAGAKGYASYEEFLQKSGADVVVLSTASAWRARRCPRPRWRSGALGTMSVTMLTYPRNMEAR